MIKVLNKRKLLHLRKAISEKPRAKAILQLKRLPFFQKNSFQEAIAFCVCDALKHL